MRDDAMSDDAMSDDAIYEQAVELEQLMPKMMRRLYTMDPEHPANELPLAQLRVCTMLQAGPRTLSSIGDELAISVSATTQIADRLERAGMVERIAGVDDRRNKYLQLSPQGAEMMRTRREIRVQRTQAALSQLTHEEREATLGVMRALLIASYAAMPECPHGDPAGVRQQQG